MWESFYRFRLAINQLGTISTPDRAYGGVHYLHSYAMMPVCYTSISSYCRGSFERERARLCLRSSKDHPRRVEELGVGRIFLSRRTSVVESPSGPVKGRGGFPSRSEERGGSRAR
jgi:hypothetical protein